MEELIRKNKQKSLVLLFFAFVIMLVVGYVLGDLFYSYFHNPRVPNYAQDRMKFALSFAAVIGVIQAIRTVLIFHSKSVGLFKMLNLKPADKDKFSKLNNVIAEMSIAAGIPEPPPAYIIPSPALNAMAFGTDPENCAIAVTSGLLAICNRDELQGVIAHELSHIINRDSLFLEVCRSTLGMVVMLRDFLLRSLYWGSMSGASYRGSSSSKGKGSALNLVFVVLGIIFAILAPVMIQIIYFALSREREYLADAESAHLTRYPPGLASALTKIAYSTHSMDDVDKVTSASFIDQPYGDVIVNNKGSGTHPPIWNRIRILKNMAGGAGFIDYQKAYNEVMQHKADFMPESMLSSKFNAPFRGAESLTDEPAFIESKEQFNALVENSRGEDIVRLSEDYGFINCECGIKIKIPPEYKKLEIKCPRCGRNHILEFKLQNALADMLDETVETGAAAGIIHEVLNSDKGDPDYSDEDEQVYHRKNEGWEEITCKCGGKVQLSPTFVGSFVHCRKCQRKIKIS
ncbi:MAG: M48 family metalloprotease [Candidatus Cloacimonetes bacterium]|nr:M48 family metalloprotease [Candidatus Cloacimonadota bacterium]